VAGFDPFSGCIHAGSTYVRPEGAGLVPSLNPADLSEVGRVAQCETRHLDLVLEPAIRAQVEWAGLDGKSRATMLHHAADRIEASIKGEVARLMTAEMGKPYTEAVGELMNVAPIYRYFAEMARNDGGFIAGSGGASMQYARYHPYGISLHIVPYNFPIILMAFTLAASLAAGNACVIKPAPATALSTLAFMECFEGLPAGLASCVTGGRDIARALIGDARIGSPSPAQSGRTRGRRTLRPAPEALRYRGRGSDP
jgi:acyl-CoA reductase-like NAD-dependent aldehyde dehydrogenase